MPVWPALLLSPLIALAGQSLLYAGSTPACEAQRGPWLHLVAFACALITVVFTVMAFTAARRGSAARHVDADMAALRGAFLAWAAVGCSALSTLAIIAMWIAQWMLSPCVA